MRRTKAELLGQRIRRLRMEKDLSQKDVAEPALTTAYLSLIESGKRVPSDQALAHIAARLAADVEELRTGKPAGLEAELELALAEARRDAYQGEIGSAEERLNEVVASAKRFGLVRVRARALCVAGSLEERRGDFSIARDLYDEAQALLIQEPAHLRFEPVVGTARCTQFIEPDGPRLAIHTLESYLIEMKSARLDDPVARMRVLSSLVHLYKAAGYERRAIEAAEEALRLGPQVDDPEQVACMNMNVARALLEQGRHDDAVAALRRAEEIYQSLDWRLPGVRSKINRGIVEADKGKLAGARETFTEALDLLQHHPQEKADTAAVMNQLARVERLLGNPREAKALLERARKILASDDYFERAMNAREMGLTVSDTDVRKAERELRRAADLYEGAGAPREAGAVLLELGQLLKRGGDIDKAFAVVTEGLELTSSPTT